MKYLTVSNKRFLSVTSKISKGPSLTGECGSGFLISVANTF
ncbi:hypothetical protein ACUXIB_001597 [Staphylococcus epidermidis]